MADVPSHVTPLEATDPERIGRYPLAGRLGTGGMGTVYLGHTEDGRPVAVKAIRREFAQEPAFRARFLREAQAARRVARFCTAEVLDVNTEGSEPYLVTEFIDGPSLSAHVREHGPLPPPELERLAVAVASALTAIHSANLIHRDLKPGNILLSPSGARVIDFGIARALENTTMHTREGGIVGTPAFMSPEQALGHPLTPAADIYAWGGVILYAATGRMPYGEAATPVVLYRVVHDEPDFSGMDSAMLALVRQAMSKDPAARPTAGALLLRLAEGVSPSDPGSGRGMPPLGAATLVPAAPAPRTPAPPSVPPLSQPPPGRTPQTPAGPSEPAGTSSPPPEDRDPARTSDLPPGAWSGPAGAPGPPPGTWNPSGPSPAPTAPTAGPARGTHRPVAVLLTALGSLVLLAAVVTTSLLLGPLRPGSGEDDPGAGGGDGGTLTATPAGASTATPAGGPVTLADYRGRVAVEITDELRRRGLEVRTTTQVSGTTGRGLVLGTEPAAGQKVSPGGTVTLAVGDGSLPEAAGWRVFKRYAADSSTNVSPIVVVDPTGNERLLGLGDNPVLSPDASRVAYTNADGEITSVRTDGTDSRQVSDEPDGSSDSPAFSPDGGTIAYARNIGGVYAVNADGSGDRRRLATVSDAYELAWSTSNQIVLRRGDDQSIYVLSVGDGDLRKLAGSPVPGAGAVEPAWSPDGGTVAFGVSTGGGIYLVNADGSGLRQAAGPGSWHPSWSPQGALVYVQDGGAARFFGANGTMRMMNPDGTGDRQLDGRLASGPVRWATAP
ncbi:serine/threonine-protein kinase [Frankia sp. R43]|uniref:serine/threonine-protein kinase n=1 Tax=Frankia sp. R43 TaxID=269536 RepID=UPI0006CA0CE7|nr:protein kinase [Frankia sp. R43]